MAPVTYVLIARVPPAGVADFHAYEALVLPLLPEHGGRLDRRVRSADGTLEVHLLVFTSAQSLAAFRADPRRAAAARLLEASGADLELTPVVPG